MRSLPGTDWERPKRILLLTYEREDHLITSYKEGVLGVPKDRGSITKASQAFRGDWALVRITQYDEF